MATAPTYCTHRQLKDVFSQIDSFDTKRPLYGWKEVTTHKYAAHNSGLTTQLFVDGEDLGAAQSAHTDLNVEGEWFYNSAEDITYYYSTSDPNNNLMEAGEEFSSLIARVTANASRYLDSKLDPSLPKEQLKDKEGNYDHFIVRTTALLAAVFLIRSHDPSSTVANEYMEEAQANISDLNQGKAALAYQITGDSAKGIIRDVTYTGSIRPLDTRGYYSGSYDVLKVQITGAGQIGSARYSVWTKGNDKLGANEGSITINSEVITGDYQPLAGGLLIRFGGAYYNSTAALDDVWEIEVFGWQNEVDNSTINTVKMTRR